MALAHYTVAVPVEPLKQPKTSILKPSESHSSLFFSAPMPRTVSISSGIGPRLSHLHAPAAQAEPQGSSPASLAAEAFTHFKHVLLPITDRNPYLSEGTRQAIATSAALANKYGADITVVVIDEKQKESIPEHETQLSTIRWHLSEGFVIRDEHGIMVAGGACPLPSLLSAEHVELLACVEAVAFAEEQGFFPLILETDAQVV